MNKTPTITLIWDNRNNEWIAYEFDSVTGYKVGMHNGISEREAQRLVASGEAFYQ